MSRCVQDIINEMEAFAPSKLKEDFDNVGLMVGDMNREVKKVLLALDCTKEVIDEAIENKCEMIITHHPLIFRKPNRIVKGDLLGDKIIKLIENKISVYSSHTNLDAIKDGINDKVVNILGFKKSKIIDKSILEDSGIGRIVYLEEPIKTKDLINNIKEKLNIDMLTGHISNEYVSNIAIINGSGSSYFNKAYEMGADCIITGDTSYHFVSDYKELGVTILDAGHFGTEWLAFLSAMENIKENIKDVEFVKSIKTSNPYSFF